MKRNGNRIRTIGQRRSLGMALGVVLTVALAAAAGQEEITRRIDFRTDDMSGWSFSDPATWKLVDSDRGRTLALTKKQGKYRPKVRSPFNYALLDAPVVSDFQLDVDLKSTIADYGHRDLCLFFGFQDPEHFYYVHFGKKADPHSNAIFLVDGKPRVSIATKTTPGTNWTDDWHHARIVRDTKSGAITVYFDDMQTPAMTASDKTFTWGKVGVGSFDDTGMFQVLELRGQPR